MPISASCHQVDERAGGRGSVRASGRRVDASVASGQDADALEAVDLDQFVRTNEVEVLALRRLSALGAADAKYLDNASVSGDAIAGTNTTGKGDLRSSRLGHGHSLLVRRWALQSARLARLNAKAVCSRAGGRKRWSLARAVVRSPAPDCSVRLRPAKHLRDDAIEIVRDSSRDPEVSAA